VANKDIKAQHALVGENNIKIGFMGIPKHKPSTHRPSFIYKKAAT
jgi:hypothetical protein